MNPTSTITTTLCAHGAIGVARIAAGTTVGFKALPFALIPASYSPQSTTEQDWAGIYPQLSLAQAIAYLPNQFERGYKTAYIVKLTAKRPLVIATCSDSQFMDGSTPSSVKAQLVRDALHCVPDAVVQQLREDLPIMVACGESEIVLCLPDAEGYELVMPKSMFTQQWLTCESLFTFHESETVPTMVGSVEEIPALHRSVLSDWNRLTQALEIHVGEHRCIDLERAVKASLVELTIVKTRATEQ